MLEYFNAQFKGAREFTFDVGPVVTLSRNHDYYGEDDEDGNDKRAANAAAEACLLSDADVDFSQYDFIYVFYAGGNPADGGASDDHIWPHAWDFLSAGIRLRLDGKLLTNYAMSSELMNLGQPQLNLTGIGTFCHEFSHILGLPDFYDVDGEKSGGKTDGLSDKDKETLDMASAVLRRHLSVSKLIIQESRILEEDWGGETNNS